MSVLRLKFIGNWIILAPILALLAFPAGANARPTAALVVDAETGYILHAENPDELIYPASLTKIMTLYMVFEAIREGRLRLDSQLPVSQKASAASPSKLGLKPGERISTEAAILGLVTKSANDVAVVVAEALGKTEPAFAKMMTAKAREMGMKDTTFRNASGLPNASQKSTARDMAVLARRMIRDFPEYYRYFSRTAYTFRGQTFQNHNRLLGSFDGTDGIKTGYIRASGFNLVASTERDGRRLVGVVIGGNTARARDEKMAHLLNGGFEKIALGWPLQPPKKPIVVAAAAASGGPAQKADLVAMQPASLDAGTPAPMSAVPDRRGREIVAVTDDASLLPGNVPETAWAIQVGAFQEVESARSAAQRAVKAVPSLPERSRISIEPFEADGRLFYRARLVGFEESDARAACRRLQKRRLDCMPIAPDEQKAALLRY